MPRPPGGRPPAPLHSSPAAAPPVVRHCGAVHALITSGRAGRRLLGGPVATNADSLLRPGIGLPRRASACARCPPVADVARHPTRPVAIHAAARLALDSRTFAGSVRRPASRGSPYPEPAASTSSARSRAHRRGRVRPPVPPQARQQAPSAHQSTSSCSCCRLRRAAAASRTRADLLCPTASCVALLSRSARASRMLRARPVSSSCPSLHEGRHQASLAVDQVARRLHRAHRFPACRPPRCPPLVHAVLAAIALR